MPTDGELPCCLSSADNGISRFTTISLSTVLVGLLCSAEFHVAASEGAKNVKTSFYRHPPFFHSSMPGHVITAASCSLQASQVIVSITARPVVVFITARPFFVPVTLRSPLIAVVPFWPFDGAIFTAGVRGWHTLCVVVDMKQKQAGAVYVCNLV